MDVSLVIRQRLEELGLEQKDLARAARVTESYISQLLTRRRPPPASNRTEIYDRLDKVLRLPQGELARLADLYRKEELQRELGDERIPLLGELRQLVLGKCDPATVAHVRAIFEREPLGELERLVTQKTLDVAKQVIRREIENPEWLRVIARASGRSDADLRALVLGFLETDMFHVSADHCAAVLNPLIESWDIDLATLTLDFALRGRAATPRLIRFAFVEQVVSPDAERGFTDFMGEPELSATASTEELDFLRQLRVPGERRPAALYYYRELQNLRDPLNFRR